jgi:hypothetical protein
VDAVVFDREEARQATEEILDDYGIRAVSASTRPANS